MRSFLAFEALQVVTKILAWNLSFRHCWVCTCSSRAGWHTWCLKTQYRARPHSHPTQPLSIRWPSFLQPPTVPMFGWMHTSISLIMVLLMHCYGCRHELHSEVVEFFLIMIYIFNIKILFVACCIRRFFFLVSWYLLYFLRRGGMYGCFLFYTITYGSILSNQSLLFQVIAVLLPLFHPVHLNWCLLLYELSACRCIRQFQGPGKHYPYPLFVHRS